MVLSGKGGANPCDTYSDKICFWMLPQDHWTSIPQDVFPGHAHTPAAGSIGASERWRHGQLCSRGAAHGFSRKPSLSDAERSWNPRKLLDPSFISLLAPWWRTSTWKTSTLCWVEWICWENKRFGLSEFETVWKTGLWVTFKKTVMEGGWAIRSRKVINCIFYHLSLLSVWNTAGEDWICRITPMTSGKYMLDQFGVRSIPDQAWEKVPIKEENDPLRVVAKYILMFTHHNFYNKYFMPMLRQKSKSPPFFFIEHMYKNEVKEELQRTILPFELFSPSPLSVLFWFQDHRH